MTVVFDAEPLLAFAFDEPGAREVEGYLDRVYDNEVDGYVTTVNLSEFRYVAIRKTSTAAADAHIEDLREIGVAEYGIDGLWSAVSDLKAAYNPALGDAYAAAAAREITTDGADTTLLVGADDDYDVLEAEGEFEGLIERFRTEPA
jgi:predicted nucleic acid-binding protein